MNHLQWIRQDEVPLMAKVSEANLRAFKFHSFHRDGNGYQVEEDTGSYRPSNGPHNSEDFDGFVQRWLWFGLLVEILGRRDGFDIRRYYRHPYSDGRSTAASVNTEHLLDDIQSWQAYEYSNPDGQTRRIIHKQSVLDKARRFIFNFGSVQGEYLFRPDRHMPKWNNVDHRIILSIMVLGQTLSRAMVRIQKTIGFEFKEWQNHEDSSEGWGYSPKIVKELQESGWCPHVLNKFFILFHGNTLGLWYISELASKPKLGEHQGCQAAPKCQFRPLKRRKKGPESPLAHGPNCTRRNCERIGPEKEELLQTIEEDKIPLLRYALGENGHAGKLDIVKMQSSFDKEYAVFSHVFSDRLGEGKGNKINECVLQWFGTIFHHIKDPQGRKIENYQDLEPVTFWLDTLCVPDGEKDHRVLKLRRKTIQGMHSIYTHANYTVVIDSGLTCVPQNRFVKIAVPILVSRWMTRLWTLQEAVLSKNLYFQLDGTNTSLRDLEQEFAREDRLSADCVPSVVRIFYHNMLGDERALVHQHDSPYWKPSAYFVGQTLKAVRWRQTAWRQHETLALATLLKLSTSDFSEGDNTAKGWTDEQFEERMQVFLDLLSKSSPCAIPPGMIFLPGDRLPKQGYRWASRTWMEPHALDPPNPISILGSPSRLNPDHGLEVQFPGFLLHDLSDKGPKSPCREIVFTPGQSLSEWYRVTKADGHDSWNLFTDTIVKDSQSRQFAIVMPQKELVHPKEIALLVYVKDERGSILYVEIVNRVWVQRKTAQGELNLLKDKFEREEIEPFSVGQRMPDNQWWCVDGPPRDPKVLLPSLLPDHPDNSEDEKSNEDDIPPLKREKRSKTFTKIAAPFEGLRKTAKTWMAAGSHVH